MATAPGLVLTFSPASQGKTALQKFQKDLISLADRGDYDAAFRLGVAYTLGHDGFSVNFPEARKYLKIATNLSKANSARDRSIQSSAEAFCLQHQTELTEAYVKETLKHAYSTRPDSGIGSYTLAGHGDDGYTPAKFLYALYTHDVDMKIEGECEERDIQDMVTDTITCAERRFMPAVGLLGILYCEGLVDGVPNTTKGLKLLEEAAIAGDGPSKMQLAKAHHFPLYNLERNLKEAKKWYTAAQDQNVLGAKGGLEMIATLQKSKWNPFK